MTQLIYRLFNKNGAGFKIHITFLMELFVTLSRFSGGGCCRKELRDR